MYTDYSAIRFFMELSFYSIKIIIEKDLLVSVALVIIELAYGSYYFIKNGIANLKGMLYG